MRVPRPAVSARAVCGDPLQRERGGGTTAATRPATSGRKSMAVSLRLARLLLCALVLAIGAGSADAYPDKPIRIIVPFPPGGFNDTLARTAAQHLQEQWGQPAIVD